MANKPQETTDQQDVGSEGALPESAKDVGVSIAQAIPPKERTRHKLAYWVIIGFIGLVGLAPEIMLFLGKIGIEQYKDVVLTLASVFAGPFGIVISNYFKPKDDQ